MAGCHQARPLLYPFQSQRGVRAEKSTDEECSLTPHASSSTSVHAALGEAQESWQEAGTSATHCASLSRLQMTGVRAGPPGTKRC